VKRQRIIALSAGLLVIAAAVIGVLPRGFSAKSAALGARQDAMEALGQSIAKLRPRCKVLVISNPFTKTSGFLDETTQFERAGLRGLRKGLGSGCPVTVAFPEIRPEYFSNRQSVVIPPDSRTPLSFVIRPTAVEELADAHPECSVVVSLIGVPAGLGQQKIWLGDDKRAFALLQPDLRLLGPPPIAVDAYERGKLLAVVADDPSLPGKPLIVTRNNVRDVLQRQPRTLGF
jgi:hypothetical protein